MSRMIPLVLASVCLGVWPNVVDAQAEPMRAVATEHGTIAFHVVGNGPGTPISWG